MEYPFSLELQVRDYECDLQGVVNNAVYLHYLEHARHEYLKSLDLDFAELARQQINLVVVRTEIDYRRPLRSGDRFLVEVRVERLSRLRFAFFQQIRKLPEKNEIVQARVIGTALDGRGRPFMPPAVSAAFGP